LQYCLTDISNQYLTANTSVYPPTGVGRYGWTTVVGGLLDEPVYLRLHECRRVKHDEQRGALHFLSHLAKWMGLYFPRATGCGAALLDHHEFARSDSDCDTGRPVLSVVYSLPEINARLQGVVTAVGQAGNGFLKLLTSGGATVSSIQLNNPCGVVNNGVLTFSGTLLDPATIGGMPTQAVITDTNGVVMVSGLTASTAATADIVLSQASIPAGTVLQLTSASITGT
jgi:hypothetical protein